MQQCSQTQSTQLNNIAKRTIKPLSNLYNQRQNLYNQNPHLQINIENLLCIENNQVKLLCCSQNCCQSTALICRKQDCLCLGQILIQKQRVFSQSKQLQSQEFCFQKRHSQCQLIYAKTFINTLLLKKKHQIPKQIKKSIDQIQKIYQQAINKLSQDRQNLLKWKQYYGLSQQEINFIQIVKSNQREKLTGNLVHKIKKGFLQFSNEERKQSLEKNWLKCQYIEQFWKNGIIDFQRIFKPLKNISEVSLDIAKNNITCNSFLNTNEYHEKNKRSLQQQNQSQQQTQDQQELNNSQIESVLASAVDQNDEITEEVQQDNQEIKNFTVTNLQMNSNNIIINENNKNLILNNDMKMKKKKFKRKSSFKLNYQINKNTVGNDKKCKKLTRAQNKNLKHYKEILKYPSEQKWQTKFKLNDQILKKFKYNSDKKQIKKINNQWEQLISTQQLPKYGKYYFQTQIIDSKNNLAVGIITQSVKHQQKVYTKKESIKYFAGGTLWKNGQYFQENPKIEDGKILKVSFDLSNRFISWWVDGQMLKCTKIGQQFMKQKIYISIQTYYRKTKFKLL